MLDKDFQYPYRALSRLWPFLGIAVIGLLLYAHTVHFDYIALDDNILIHENKEFIQNPLNVFEAFRRSVYISDLYAPAYRPMVTVSLIADAQVAGENIRYFRLINVLYHIIAAWLLFSLLRIFGHRKLLAFMATIIFVVHPIVTSNVAWVPGRNDILLGIFVLASFIFFIKYIRRTKNQSLNIILHLFFLLLALLTKETAVALPILCGLWFLCSIKDCEDAVIPKKIIPLCTGWFVILVTWILMRMHALDGGGFKDTLHSLLLGITQNFMTPILYLGKIFYPDNLSLLSTVENMSVIFGILATLILILIIASSQKERRKYVILGIAWYLLFILPTFAAVLIWHAEQRLYVPFMGILFILLEAGFLKYVNLKSFRVLVPYILIVLSFCLTTFAYSYVYKDYLTFWYYTARSSKKEFNRDYAYGEYWLLKGNRERSDELFLAAYSTNEMNETRHRTYFLHAQAVIYLREGKKEGEDILSMFTHDSLRFHQADSRLYYWSYFDLGALYFSRKEYELAQKMFTTLLTIYPHDFLSDFRLFDSYVVDTFPSINPKELKDFIRQIPRGGV